MWPSDAPSWAASYWEGRCNLKLCPGATTLVDKKLWVRFWTTSKASWPVHWPSRYFHLLLLWWWYWLGCCIAACREAVDCGKKCKWEFGMYPALLRFFYEPCNSFLSTHNSVSVFAFIVDTAAIVDIWQCNLDIDCPTYTVEIDYLTFGNHIINLGQIIQIPDSAVQFWHQNFNTWHSYISLL